MTASADTLPESTVRSARSAVFAAFAVNGMAFAAFASRVPDIKHELGLSPGSLGVVLLAASVGSIVGLPLAGPIVHRFGARLGLRVSALVQVVGYVFAGVSVTVLGSREALMASLVVVGLGIGVYDVGMNLEGASVERLQRRSIMPHFHAAFSGGTVVSALIGALLSALHAPVLAHLVGAAVIVLAVTAWSTAQFLPRSSESGEPGAEGRPGRARLSAAAAWREPRTLLIGVVVLAAAFTEGTANDWIAVAFSEGHDLPRWAGVLAFAVFLSAMTVGRIVGTRLLDTHGRVPVLRVLFVFAVVGCVLVVFGNPVLAFLGAIVWGLGASLGFPVGMSAAADDPERAAVRMSVVSTIGYTAFLGGPPLLGFLGDHVGVLHALLVVGAMAVIALLVVPAVREPDRQAPV